MQADSTKLGHISILVSNLAKARQFYSEILGLSEIQRPSLRMAGIWYQLADIELHLMLYENMGYPPTHDTIPTATPHFALAIQKESLATLRQTLQRNQIVLIDEPFPEKKHLCRFFFRDFDGNMIECYEQHNCTS